MTNEERRFKEMNKKPPKSFRLNPELVDKAQSQGLDLVALFEASIAKALKDKRCPYCNSELKKRPAKS